MRRALGALILMTTMVTAAAVAVVPAVADEATPGQRPATEARWQHALDDITATAAVGALAEVHDGRHVWRGTSGVAELGRARPVPTRGLFRAGSITKTFVATVVLQLVDEGRLRLADPVERWLPGVVPDGGRITVRELLDQTSGLPDVVPTLPKPPDPAFYDNRWRTWTTEELAQRALAQPTTGDPGAAFHYSSTNYLLLAEVVEKVTGRSYAAEVERRIIRPLRLRHTSLPGTSVGIPGPHPHGYVPGPDGALVDYTRMNPSVFGAAGELISDAHDLDRFFAALLGGRLLPPELLGQMETPLEDSPYGLGLFVRTTTCGVTVIGHDGDALAYQAWSYATTDLRRRVTVAITPSFAADSDEFVDAFLARVFCS
ncbi:MAG TPA: serine hydrolase domain-containing protein [Nocardioides sp.]|uniref:serine hydrolase domain-containing protein n=1 Tax=Nocardioides sp. TaxID=35761 RepID=UPI002E2ECBDF|nr:serine hydrolase domain-containing protein [Nocardioides sp.]HEX5090191.1 serine hydrolase domain-containing protein [Nocardioides sp.]